VAQNYQIKMCKALTADLEAEELTNDTPYVSLQQGYSKTNTESIRSSTVTLRRKQLDTEEERQGQRTIQD